MLSCDYPQGGEKLVDLEPALARPIPLGNITRGFAEVDGSRARVIEADVDLPDDLATGSDSHYLGGRSRVDIASQIWGRSTLNGSVVQGLAYGRRVIPSAHLQSGEDV